MLPLVCSSVEVVAIQGHKMAEEGGTIEEHDVGGAADCSVKPAPLDVEVHLPAIMVFWTVTAG